MTAIAHQPHPVSRVLTGVRDQLREVAGLPVWSMDATETTDTIAGVQSAKAQLAALEARLLSHADRIDLAGSTGATSTANWRLPGGAERLDRSGQVMEHLEHRRQVVARSGQGGGVAELEPHSVAVPIRWTSSSRFIKSSRCPRPSSHRRRRASAPR